MKLKAMLYVPENEENFRVDIYSEENPNHIAEIYKDETNNLKIEIFNNPKEESWNLDLKQLIEVLQKSYTELNVE